MSEYLSKKAVLEWLESEMSINKGHPDDIDIHWTLNRVSKKSYPAHLTLTAKTSGCGRRWNCVDTPSKMAISKMN